MINNYNLFKDEGHILLKEFIINDNFDQICINLKREILEEYKNLDKKKNRWTCNGKPQRFSRKIQSNYF